MQRGREGRGAIVYMRGHEGRGIGLVQKLRAYAEQDAGADTIEANAVLACPSTPGADAAVSMLRHLGVQRLRLLTNNPLKVAALQDLGLEVVARESVLTAPGRTTSAICAPRPTRWATATWATCSTEWALPWLKVRQRHRRHTEPGKEAP